MLFGQWAFLLLASGYILFFLQTFFWRGSGTTPLETTEGRLALSVLFVGFPIYIFLRISRPIGLVFTLVSLFLFSIGWGILMTALEALGRISF